jgi:hypothetical protein
MSTKDIFREAVKPTPNSNARQWQRAFYSPFSWAALTSLFIFVFLYLINPPITQCQKSDNDMIKPVPNLMTIVIVSIASGVIVLGLHWYVK